jgi:hypothetical protein
MAMEGHGDEGAGAGDPRLEELAGLLQHAEPANGSGSSRPVAVLSDKTTDPVRIRRDADAIEAELRATARSNADARAAVVRRKETRGRIERTIVCALLLLCGLWVADNAIGFIATPKRTAVVYANGDRYLSAQYLAPANGHGIHEKVDCWSAGSRERVWKAAAPFGSVIPYRCGDSAALIVAPGPISTLVIGFGVMCALGLAVVYRRRARAWF